MNNNAIASLDVARSIFRNAPVGVLIVSKDSASIVCANIAIEQMLGYGAGELEGQGLDRLLPNSIRDRHTSLIAGFFASPRQRMMGSGGELYASHRDGHAIPVEIALAPMSVDGKSCAIAYITNLSARVQELRQREHLMHAMPQGVLLVDHAGAIVMTNPALDAQFGYAPGELKGLPLETLLPERYRHGHTAHMLAFASNPQQRKMGVGRDLTGLHKTGVEFPVEIALNAVEFGDAQLLMAVVSDISIRKRAEHLLRQTNAQLEEFTYVASHDLRSPLRGIADLLSWIKEDIPTESMTPSMENNFDRISLRIERCERMIDDLLEYARAGRSGAASTMTDLDALVVNVVNDLSVPAGFSIECDIHVTPFSTVQTPLNLSLRNLISNAIKHHGGDSGRILVRAQEEGRFAVITVEDDGPGVPEGAEDRIFKLFHRATTTTEGHGVGLAVTRRMINAHNGHIIVQRSERLGGACFRIHWPRIEMKEISDE